MDCCSITGALALDLLRVVLAGAVDCGLEIPLVGAPVVGIVARDAKRREQRLQLQKQLILTSSEDIGQDFSGLVIKGMPEPTWLFLLGHKAPHFLHFGFIHALQDDLDMAWVEALDQEMIHWGE
ncbi:MAG TPA: hypothetical protein VFM05_08220 [Candidatus Saccharimonadales bacterium]|nr:hypothetical protein [Candidatus Saccharimonadales bacterium]